MIDSLAAEREGCPDERHSELISASNPYPYSVYGGGRTVSAHLH